jgi:hypothetical protein
MLIPTVVVLEEPSNRGTSCSSSPLRRSSSAHCAFTRRINKRRRFVPRWRGSHRSERGPEDAVRHSASGYRPRGESYALVKFPSSPLYHTSTRSLQPVLCPPILDAMLTVYSSSTHKTGTKAISCCSTTAECCTPSLEHSSPTN